MSVVDRQEQGGAFPRSRGALQPLADRAATPDGAEPVSAPVSGAAGIPSAGLWHYGRAPFALEPRNYEQAPELRLYDKPEGLWISVEGENDWPSWCQSEGFALDRLSWAHPVTLLPEANVLWLKCGSELGDFEREYGREKHWGGRYTDLCIDWRAVARAHDGIFIAPYQWSCRLSRRWYYPWDCSSGCVWNVNVIAVGPAQVGTHPPGRDATQARGEHD